MNSLSIDGDRVVLRGAGPDRPAEVIDTDLAGDVVVLRRANPSTPEREDVSIPEHIEFPTTGDRMAFGNFYAPTNRSFVGPAGELPPLIVTSHGGPTASAFSGFATGIQLFTSRGYAVLDVDYGGSTGYGKAYRKRLELQWGVVDVEDCVAAAQHLVAAGEVDPARLAIDGGSAGGYTTLCALTFTDVFAAGASFFGIGDLETFVRDTHKFESRYLDRLVGPYPASAALYRERSPVHHVERLSCPVILFQGLEDRIVPPNQAETMVAALREKGEPVAYLPFEGEQHGFRKAENIKRALDAELYFYSRIFGFEPADLLEPVDIENL
jgi:dipeptidyl aminopeptidase/acylaminoacyl peptidase